MHNQLEEYLKGIAERLGPLPKMRRNEEIKEMRHHLMNAVIVNQASGQSEDEAVVSALEQFGAHEEVGEAVVRAWRRGEAAQDKRSLWGAAACTLALNFLTGWADALLFAHGQVSLAFLGLVMAVSLGFRVLVGGISGFLFPRRAVVGTALAMSYTAAQTIRSAIHTPHTLPLHVMALIIAVGLIFNLTLNVGATVLSAWAGSRWRMRRERMVAG